MQHTILGRWVKISNASIFQLPWQLSSYSWLLSERLIRVEGLSQLMGNHNWTMSNTFYIFQQIFWAVWTNIFDNSNKYIGQFGQIHFARNHMRFSCFSFAMFWSVHKCWSLVFLLDFLNFLKNFH